MLKKYEEQYVDYQCYCKKCKQLMMGVSLERERHYDAHEVIIEDECQHCGHHNEVYLSDLEACRL